jgi:hypothetical protein
VAFLHRYSGEPSVFLAQAVNALGFITTSYFQIFFLCLTLWSGKHVKSAALRWLLPAWLISAFLYVGREYVNTMVRDTGGLAGARAYDKSNGGDAIGSETMLVVPAGGGGIFGFVLEISMLVLFGSYFGFGRSLGTL